MNKLFLVFLLSLPIIGCSKPEDKAAALGFDSVEQMEEVKKLGFNSMNDYLTSLLAGSGCANTEELKHAMQETGSDCNYLKKLRKEQEVDHDFPKINLVGGYKVSVILNGDQNIKLISENMTRCAAVVYFGYESIKNGTILPIEGASLEDLMQDQLDNFSNIEDLVKKINPDLNFKEIGQLLYSEFIDVLGEIKENEGEVKAAEAALLISKEGNRLCSTYGLSPRVQDVLKSFDNLNR